MTIHLNNAGQECKIDPVWDGYLWEGKKDWESKRGSMHFIYLYENRPLKPVKIILSREEHLDGERWWG
jgi:hypothetical protein